MMSKLTRSLGTVYPTSISISGLIIIYYVRGNNSTGENPGNAASGFKLVPEKVNNHSQWESNNDK